MCAVIVLIANSLFINNRYYKAELFPGNSGFAHCFWMMIRGSKTQEMEELENT